MCLGVIAMVYLLIAGICQAVALIMMDLCELMEPIFEDQD
jgi:hypothetical protein